MSELIEVHQLDYKACSLTYGEGACTARGGDKASGQRGERCLTVLRLNIDISARYFTNTETGIYRV